MASDFVKRKLKEKYQIYCAENDFPCEILKTTVKIEKNLTITQLIKYAQDNCVNKSKINDKSKYSLYELITLYAKLCAILVRKIKRFDENFSKYDYEILRFFALTNAYSIRIEKIKRRIQEFCPIALKLREKFYEILKNRYGQKENASISTSEYKGHNILVSGDDLIELEYVLKTVEKMELQDKINVYTNGSLILAHFYPYFKNNKILKGHWGVNDAQYDFSKFEGSILITRNFLQKIDSLYKGEIYSSKVISFSKVIDIKNDNYEPLINSSLSNFGFIKQNQKTTLNIDYDIKKLNKAIDETVNNGIKEVVVVAGNLDTKKIDEEYKNKKIIHFSTPLESDILFSSVEKLIKHNLKVAIFFAHCDIESIFSLFLLLNQDIDIYIADCSHIIINPHVIEALCENFNVKIIK